MINLKTNKKMTNLKTKKMRFPETRCEFCDQPPSAVLDRIRKNIADCGWSAMYVLGDDDNLPFMYTIGNYEIGLPELLIIGITGGGVLNFVCENMRDCNRPFTDGELVETLGPGHLKALNASDVAKTDYTLLVGDYYGTEQYAVQQLLIPDKDGRYPDDPQCNFPYSLVPVLRSKTNLH